MKNLLLLAFIACRLLGSSQEITNYQFKITTAGAANPHARLSAEASLPLLAELLPPHCTIKTEEATLTVDCKDDIDPVKLEAALKARGIILSSFEKNGFSNDGQLTFVLFYKPANRDAARIKK